MTPCPFSSLTQGLVIFLTACFWACFSIKHEFSLPFINGKYPVIWIYHLSTKKFPVCHYRWQSIRIIYSIHHLISSYSFDHHRMHLAFENQWLQVLTDDCYFNLIGLEKAGEYGAGWLGSSDNVLISERDTWSVRLGQLCMVTVFV